MVGMVATVASALHKRRVGRKGSGCQDAWEHLVHAAGVFFFKTALFRRH